MSRPTSRRPASSRGTTPRPRKLAGQTTTRPDGAAEDIVPAVEPEAEAVREPRLRLRKERVTAPDVPTPDVDASTDDADGADGIDGIDGIDGGGGLLARPRTTRRLVIALVVVALVLFAQAVWFGILKLTEDDPAPKAEDVAGEITVPSGRPVVASEIATVEGVEAAAKAAQDIVAVDFQKYDAEIDAAAKLMTAKFEAQYRTTTRDIKEQFVLQKTVVQANVVAQGVVRANRTKLQALVFLNQVTSRERDGKPETVVTPFKVLVTMVHTDQGWLVDKLDTDQRRDKNN
ncbi:MULTISPECIES: hypothetical protein [unclassified Nocardioides]|uniref:hypothetical protein n=1 Tax=unclassified Nocardioides TaxID=2615069 RepID=UPI0006FA0F3D|nr:MULTISPECIES: hypothetical protein [unclassified Nocardioides]KRA37222.1 hypothetical protein ASD81_00290 [Nocardioides sp. Root614]KRA91183.1 hypothetical protein ASD84_00555 [Nocardioides sp. Root682]